MSREISARKYTSPRAHSGVPSAKRVSRGHEIPRCCRNIYLRREHDDDSRTHDLSLKHSRVASSLRRETSAYRCIRASDLSLLRALLLRCRVMIPQKPKKSRTTLSSLILRRKRVSCRSTRVFTFYIRCKLNNEVYGKKGKDNGTCYRSILANAADSPRDNVFFATITGINPMRAQTVIFLDKLL